MVDQGQHSCLTASMASEATSDGKKRILGRAYGVKIGNNCWIGAKAIILDGTKIGNGCIIAAGSVVRGEFPDNVIIGGVPA